MIFFTRRGKAGARVNYVEWIESTGTQYIDTKVAHTSASKIVLQLDVTYDNVSSGHQLMGFTGNAGNAIGPYGAAWWESTSLGSVAAGKRYSLEFAVNGTSYYRSVDGATVSGTRQTYTYSSNLYLFAVKDSATSTAISCYCHCKLYNAKITVDGVLVRDFYPCYDPAGVACLYDKVESKYYYNQGSGEFVAGSDEENGGGGSGGVNLITFSVGGVRCTVEEGMTWAQFAASSYDTIGCYTNGNTVMAEVPAGAVSVIYTTLGSPVKATDAIESNGYYIAQ